MTYLKRALCAALVGLAVSSSASAMQMRSDQPEWFNGVVAFFYGHHPFFHQFMDHVTRPNCRFLATANGMVTYC